MNLGRKFWLALFSFSCLLLVGCSSNGSSKAYQLALLGADDFINGHKVTITPCVMSEHQTLRDISAEDSKHVVKCNNHEVVIENEMLSVNGKNYGKMVEKASVKVENQKVFINDTETHPVDSATAAPQTSERTVRKKLAKTWRALWG